MRDEMRNPMISGDYRNGSQASIRNSFEETNDELDTVAKISQA